MEHTPGPWIAEGQTIKAISHGQWFKIGRAENPKIITAAHRANATLMAAAPEMLDAIRAVMEWHSANLPVEQMDVAMDMICGAFKNATEGV